MSDPLDLARLEEARSDIEVFAREVLGMPLWPHQADVAKATTRVTAMLCGRQSGKTFVLAVLALWHVLQEPGQFVLIASAGEQSSKDVLALCSSLARVPVVETTIDADTVLEMKFTNGSTIRAIAASERKARGPSADLLIVDEACFVPEEIHTALLGTTVARPRARIVYASTPFGRQDRHFARAYRLGQGGADGYSSFWWPASVSPLVDDAVLATLRLSMSERAYQAEIEALWLADEGALFSADTIEAAVEDYELIPPGAADGMTCPVGGVDWGRRVDANALVLLATREDGLVWVPWLVERYGMRYLDFIRTVLVPAAEGYAIARLASETVGVGDAATESLVDEFTARRIATKVVGVDTTNALKAEAFNALSLLFEQRRIAIPRHPALLGQLYAAEFTTTEAGHVRFGVPESAGHDDLLVAFAFATLHFRRHAAAEAKLKVALGIDIAAINRGLRRASYWGAGAGIRLTGTAGGAQAAGLVSFRDAPGRPSGNKP